MEIIDTHTHLYLEDFDKDFDQVISRAIERGVNKLIFPAINSNYINKMIDLEHKYPENIRLMTGLHPAYIKENFYDELDIVANSLKKHNYVAIGETGIDLYWDKSYIKQQQEAFEFQVRLAKSNDLPLVIHCRDGFDQVFEILEAEKCSSMRGVFHCFSGSLPQAIRAIKLGFKLGVGGVVTFKNSGLDKVLEKISLNNIVIETDSPYLSPNPVRGKRNESSYLIYIINKLSDIYSIETEIIAKIVYSNSRKLFKF